MNTDLFRVMRSWYWIFSYIDDTKQNPVFWLIAEHRTTHVGSSMNPVNECQLSYDGCHDIRSVNPIFQYARFIRSDPEQLPRDKNEQYYIIEVIDGCSLKS